MTLPSIYFLFPPIPHIYFPFTIAVKIEGERDREEAREREEWVRERWLSVSREWNDERNRKREADRKGEKAKYERRLRKSEYERVKL